MEATYIWNLEEIQLKDYVKVTTTKVTYAAAILSAI